MSKELEALNKIQHDFGQLKGQELVKCYETIFNGLKRLESIDNAKPSEALKELDRIKNQLFEYFKSTEVRDGDIEDYEKLIFEPIKQALLKAQEQEKVFEIIKEKRVNVDLFWNDFIDNKFGYHYYLEKWYKYQSIDKQKLTEEEFDLLKRWLG